ncbi:unnamed protein product, partial [Durusdinium trenchii]
QSVEWGSLRSRESEVRKSEHCSTPAEHWCKFDRINGISLGAKLIQVNDVE